MSFTWQQQGLKQACLAVMWQLRSQLREKEAMKDMKFRCKLLILGPHPHEGYEPVLVEATLLAGAMCDGGQQLVLLGPCVGVALQSTLIQQYESEGSGAGTLGLQCVSCMKVKPKEAAKSITGL